MNIELTMAHLLWAHLIVIAAVFLCVYIAMRLYLERRERVNRRKKIRGLDHAVANARAARDALEQMAQRWEDAAPVVGPADD